MTTKVASCRSCDSSLILVLRLGDQRIAGWLDHPDEASPAAPLDLMLCSNTECRLLQLGHTVKSDLLFRNYYYRSGMNQTMRDALADITTQSQKKVVLERRDTVVDIGANDGTLLNTYPQGITKIGFEPALNLREDAERGGNHIISDYFSRQAYPEKANKAKIVTAIAMFYDLEDPHQFVSDVADILADDGVFTIQLSYLPLMLFQNAFDNVCHEHLAYHSLRSLDFIVSKHGLKMFDAEINDVNAGSIRVYMGRERSPSPMMIALRQWEEAIRLDTRHPFDEFAERVEAIRDQLVSIVGNITSEGKKVYGYAASTKGNVTLQYCGFGPEHIPAIADINRRKWGKYCAGSGIPVVSEEEARKDNPDYFLVLAWAFMDEFRRREEKWRRQGGQFIIPMPEVRIE